MIIHPTNIDGLVVAESQLFKDERGAFARLFCEQELSSVIGVRKIVQINHSCTSAVGTIRGLHFQHAPHAEMKLVMCLKGKVWDVAVDLRKGSPTFLRWHAELLSADNHKTLAIPEGFAHGFQTLTDDCEMLYLHTAAYSPRAEAGLNPQDAKLGIAWPLPIAKISTRDATHALIADDFEGVVQ